MATWVHPASWSQSAKANRAAVIVRKVRISFTGSSPSILVMRHAVTVFLWTSRPQHWDTSRPSCTSMRCDHARDARFMQHLCYVLPQGGATDGGASEHPGPTVGRLAARESSDLLRAVV